MRTNLLKPRMDTDGHRCWVIGSAGSSRLCALCGLIAFGWLAAGLGADAQPFLTLRREKPKPVRALAFSPDGKLLTVGSSAPSAVKITNRWEGSRLPEGTIELWSVAEGKAIRTLRQSAWKQNSDTFNQVNAIAFSPDGRWLLGSDNVGYILWDANTGEPVRKWHGSLFNHHSSPDWSADGRFLALPWHDLGSARRPGTVLIEVATGKETAFFPVVDTGFVYSARISPDGRLLATAGQDCMVRVFDLKSGSCLFTDDQRCILETVCFSADGRRLVGGSSWAGVLLAYDIDYTNGQPQVHQRVTSSATGEGTRFVEFTADGKQALAITDSGIRLWDASGWRESKVLAGCMGRLSPDGKSIALAREATPEVVELWRLEELPLVPAAILQAPEPRPARSQPDPAIACFNNLRQLGLAARMWGMEHKNLAPPDFLSMKELLVQTRVLFCPADTNVPTPNNLTWDSVSTNMISYEFVNPGLALSGSSVAVQVLFRCPIHGHTCMGDGNVVRSPPTGTSGGGASKPGGGAPVGAKRTGPAFEGGRVLDGHSSATFSSDGKRLAALSGNPAGIKVWDCDSGEVILAFGNPPPLAERGGGDFTSFEHVVFTPDNKRLITAGLFPAHGLAIWDASSGQRLKTFGTNLLSLAPAQDSPFRTMRVNPQMRFMQLVLSQGGERVYTVACDYGRSFVPGAVGCWNAESGELTFSLHPTSRTLWGLVQSPDGKYMAARIEPDPMAAMRGQAFPPPGKPTPDNLRASRPVPAADARSRETGIAVWDGLSGQRKHLLPVTGMPKTFSPDGTRLVVFAGGEVSGIAEMRMWDVERGKECIPNPLADIKPRSCGQILFSRDGTLIALIVDGKKVALHEVATGRLLRTLDSATAIHHIAFSPDGETLAAGCGDPNEIYGSSGDVKLWSVKDGRLVKHFKGQRSFVSHVRFSPDGKRLMSLNPVSLILRDMAQD